MVNKLELHFFDNKADQLKYSTKSNHQKSYEFDYELIDNSLNNYTEFFIDGIMLIKYLFGEKKHRGYLSDYNGLLGPIGPFYDELLISSLLLKKIDIHSIQTIFKLHNKKTKERYVNLLLRIFNLPRVHIYGCKSCADLDCGGITIKVTRNSAFYFWEVPFHLNNPGKLNFKFKKSDYENTFNSYLKSIRRNRSLDQII